MVPVTKLREARFVLGDMVRIYDTPTFKPSDNIFENIIGFDKYGPIFALPDNSRLVCLDTPERVEEFNRTGTVTS